MSMAHDVYGIVAVGCDAASNELTLAAGAALPKAIYPAWDFTPIGPSWGIGARAGRGAGAHAPVAPGRDRRGRAAVVLAQGRGRSGHAHDPAAAPRSTVC